MDMKSQLIPFLLALALTDAAAERLPVDYFSRKPEYSQMQLSPDGSTVAALIPWKNRLNLAVIDLASRKGIRLTAIETQDIAGFRWINNERLVFSVDDQGNEAFGLYAVNRDGSKAKTLIAAGKSNTHTPRSASVLSTIRHDPEEIIVAYNDRRESFPDLYRLNTHTGRSTLLTYDSPGDVVRWELDHQHLVRLAIAQDKSATQIYYRKNEQAPWRLLDKLTSAKWIPLAFTEDNKKIYIRSQNDREQMAITLYDPETQEISNLPFEYREGDIASIKLDPYSNKLLGFATEHTQPSWTDETYRLWQTQIDQTLPATVNTLVSVSQNRERAIVFSRSESDPGSFYLFTPEKLALEKLADAASWIDPKKTGRQRLIRYRNRDNVPISGTLTISPEQTAKDLPSLIYLDSKVAQGTRQFDPLLQFLVSRGYAVLQIPARTTPEGLALQNDSEDAAKWLIDQGIADQQRIGIIGIGAPAGRAALLALSKTPALYRCGISYAGVIDAASAASIDATKRPLLLAYGTQDPHNSAAEFKKLNSALPKNLITEIVKTDEGSFFRKEESIAELYRKIDSFLQQHLTAP